MYVLGVVEAKWVGVSWDSSGKGNYIKSFSNTFSINRSGQKNLTFLCPRIMKAMTFDIRVVHIK